MTLPALIIGALAVAVWLVILVERRPMAIATVAFLTAFVAQTEFGLTNSIVSRVPIALFLGLAILFALGEQRAGRSGLEQSLAPLRAETMALVALLAVTLAVTESVSDSVEALAGAAAVLFVGVTLGRFVPTSSTLDRLFIGSGIMVVLSVGNLGVSGTAWEAGRLRGIFENANGLGSAAMIAMAATPRRLVLIMTPLLGGVIVASGSRASGLGFLIVVLLRIEWRPSTRIGAVVMAPLVIAALAFLGLAAFGQEVDRVQDPVAVTEVDSSVTDDAAILRTRDNRTAQWTQGLVDIRDNLPLGSGYGTAAFEYSNSPITLAVQTGALAVPILLVGAHLGVRSIRHHDRRVRALGFGMAAHSLFEGWMFAFGSFSALIFWTVLTSASADYLRSGRPSATSVLDLTADDSKAFLAR